MSKEAANHHKQAADIMNTLRATTTRPPSITKLAPMRKPPTTRMLRTGTIFMPPSTRRTRQRST